jgi:hypothetical protein
VAIEATMRSILVSPEVRICMLASARLAMALMRLQAIVGMKSGHNVICTSMKVQPFWFSLLYLLEGKHA